MPVHDDPRPPEGHESLLAMVLHHLDPRIPEPDKMPEPARAGGADDETLTGLQGLMMERLRGEIRSSFRTLRKWLFVLTAEQAATLDRLGIPEETREGVKALNCLMMPNAEHRVSVRLRVIAAIPPTPEDGGMADWKRWWLEWHAQRIGVTHPQDHDPERDRLAEILNTVIAAMAREAEPAIPGPAETARHLLRVAELPPRKRGENREAGPENTDLPIRLSAVWAAGVRISWLAHGIGMRPEAVRARWGETPEKVADALAAGKIPFRRDTGTVGDIRELRDILAREEIKETWMSCGNQRWHDREAKDGWIVNQSMGRELDMSKQSDTGPTEPGPTEPGPTEPGPTEPGRDDGRGENRPGDAETGPMEQELMALTVPGHPLEQGVAGLDEVAAFRNRTTPDRAKAYLEGRNEEWHPEGLTPCPQAGACASSCGDLQTSGGFPFPLTRNGDHGECAYRRFLARYGALKPEQREQAAAAELKPARRDRDRGLRKEMSQQGGKVDLPEEERDAEQPAEVNPEKVHGAGAADDAPSGARTIQPALF